jgi:hypothetical protein
MIAVPRVNGAFSAAKSETVPPSKTAAAKRIRNARLMPSVTPRKPAYSSQKAPHMVVKRLFEERISNAQRATIRPLLVTTTQRPS